MRPITPMPGYVEADAHALLASKAFVFGDAFSIFMKDGSILRYCSGQQDMQVVPIGNPTGTQIVFTSKKIKISGLKMKVSTGVEVDEQDMDMEYGTQVYLNQPFGAAIIAGRFDGATIRRDRYYRSTYGQGWVFGIPLFVGRTSTASDVGRSGASMKVKSDLVQLNIQMPRKVFQPNCTRTLFDPDCTLNREDFQVQGVLDAGSTADSLVWSGANEGFKYGTIHISDVESVLQIRTIKDVVGDVISLVDPLAFAPSEGSNFVAYPGCIRSYARCGDFNNQEHFQAFEFVPVAETAN